MAEGESPDYAAQLREAQETIKSLKSQVAGYEGAQKQDKAVIGELNAKLTGVQNDYAGMTAKLKVIEDQLPALARAARDAKKLDAMSDFPAVLGNKALRKLALAAEVPDDEFTALIQELATGLVPPAPAPAPAVTPPPAATPPQAPEPTPAVQPAVIQAPPDSNSGFGSGVTAAGLKDAIAMALKKGDFGQVDALTDQLIQFEDDNE